MQARTSVTCREIVTATTGPKGKIESDRKDWSRERRKTRLERERVDSQNDNGGNSIARGLSLTGLLKRNYTDWRLIGDQPNPKSKR